jgi:hypothetical protein
MGRRASDGARFCLRSVEGLQAAPDCVCSTSLRACPCPTLPPHRSDCSTSDADAGLFDAPSPAGSGRAPSPHAGVAWWAGADGSDPGGSRGSSGRGGGSGQLSGRSSKGGRAYRLDAGKYLQLTAKQRGLAAGVLDASAVGAADAAREPAGALNPISPARGGGGSSSGVREEYLGTALGSPPAGPAGG